ncbi:hypothetical protein ACS0TY_033910 [Phlomoides rotata]
MDNFKESKGIKKDDNYSESSSAFYSSSEEEMQVDDDDASPSRGPLYDLADLMAQLPIKRGLSKFYNGKSQTFGSLSNLKSNKDLGKKEMSGIIRRRRMKSSKSDGGNLNRQHKVGPKATIKKTSPKI